jgi:hypothetical protein
VHPVLLLLILLLLLLFLLLLGLQLLNREPQISVGSAGPQLRVQDVR